VAVSGPKGSGGGVFSEINITPLTDIFLVLLIIFMVTTSVTIESAAHVDMPLAENTSPENKGVIVTLHLAARVVRQLQRRSGTRARGNLHEALVKIDPKIVVFQGDRKVLLGDMVRILGVAKRAGGHHHRDRRQESNRCPD